MIASLYVVNEPPVSFQRIETRLLFAFENMIEGIEVTVPYVMSVGWYEPKPRELRSQRVKRLLFASSRPIELPLDSVNHTNRLVPVNVGVTRT